MTREEEIKAHLYEYPVPAAIDLRYLLARNEELQRRVELMQAVIDAAPALIDAITNLNQTRADAPNGLAAKILAYSAAFNAQIIMMSALAALDAKEQHNDQAD